MNLTLLKHNYFIDSYLNKDFFSTTNTKELTTFYNLQFFLKLILSYIESFRKRGGTPKLRGIERNLNTKESCIYNFLLCPFHILVNLVIAYLIRKDCLGFNAGKRGGFSDIEINQVEIEQQD